MKLGISLLIAGIIALATGVALWQDGLGKIHLNEGIWASRAAYQVGVDMKSAGLGLMVLGGGSTLSGIAIMIVKKH